MTTYFFQAGISILVALITLLGGYIILGPKLRKEQKSEFQKRIGEKKADALTEFKEIIAECDKIELYAQEEDFRREIVLKLKRIDNPFYPAFMNSGDDLFDMIERVSTLRKSEMYLDREAAAYLLYFYKYLFELTNFISARCADIDYPTLGTVFIVDLQRWTNAADKIVNRDINKARVKVESHKDSKWNAIKNKVFTSLYDNSILHLLQMDPAKMNEIEYEQYVAISNIFEEYRKPLESQH